MTGVQTCALPIWDSHHRERSVLRCDEYVVALAHAEEHLDDLDRGDRATHSTHVTHVVPERPADPSLLDPLCNRNNGKLFVMLSMRRKWPSVVLSVALVVSVFAESSGVSADAVSDQKKQVEQLAAQLVSLNHRIEALAEDYGAAQDLKASLDVQIVASTEKVAAEQTQYDLLMGTVSDIAVKRFMGGTQGSASPLLSSVEAFSQAQQYDALSAVAYDTGAANADDVQ